MTANIAVQVAEKFGFHVHPCGQNKKPTSPHGFHDAENAAAAIRDLWRRHPGPLVGVACGPRSDLCIVDLDPHKPGSEALDWLDENANRIPETFVYGTRSGGTHFAFRYAPGVGNSQSRLAHSVDVRGNGGYAVAWWAHGCPVICNAPPAPMPEWLAKAAMPPPPPAPVPYDGEPSPAVYRLARVNGVIRFIAGLPEGQRHTGIFWAACTLGELVRARGLSEGEAVAILTRTTERAGWTEPKKTRATILDGVRRTGGVGA